jgi:hypothetical protein
MIQNFGDITFYRTVCIKRPGLNFITFFKKIERSEISLDQFLKQNAISKS